MSFDKKLKEQKSKNTTAPKARWIFLFGSFSFCQNSTLMRFRANSRQQCPAPGYRVRAIGKYTGFVFPYMHPDEIDRFINWAIQKGYNIHQISSSGDSFKRTIYNQYAARYNKKKI